VAFQRATHAVAAAVAAQRAMAGHPWPEGAPMRVRIGLHTGEPTCAAGGYVGLDVHRAAPNSLYWLPGPSGPNAHLGWRTLPPAYTGPCPTGLPN
jgi:hypothetical protein